MSLAFRSACLVTVLACLAHAAEPAAEGLPGVIRQRGVYSRDYAGDWRNLPTGDVLARRDHTGTDFQDVIGEEARKSWVGEDEVRLTDLALRVRWNGESNKMRTTLFTIRECRRVVIENVDIIQLDPDYRGYDTIRIEDCDEVIIRNSHFGGTVHHYHLRLEGCGAALIERVEIAGHDHGELGLRGGGGIFVQNGATGRGGPRDNMIRSPNPRELSWLVIQHCLFRDLAASDGQRRNQDGILIHSPTEGIIFNCVVDNWSDAHGDAGMDVGFRRSDLENGFFRIERNLFRRCGLNKSPGGAGHPSNALLWANNVFDGGFFGDYHGLWPLHHVHNTHIIRDRQPLYKLWGRNEGPAHIHNCLVYNDEELPAHQVVFQNDRGEPTRYRNLAFDHNTYLMAPPGNWVSGRGATVADWEAWRETENQDRHSRMAAPEDCFANLAAGDYRLRPGTLPVGAASTQYLNPEPPWLKVDRDFLGNPRPAAPAAGAFEPGAGEVP